MSYDNKKFQFHIEMYKQRVSADKSGDLDKRTKSFDEIIKKKLDNWWMNHSKKYIEAEPEE